VPGGHSAVPPGLRFYGPRGPLSAAIPEVRDGRFTVNQTRENNHKWTASKSYKTSGAP
jgi:hypothetical protein